MPRTMTARFDVTGLSDQEIEQLASEVAVQAEPSDHIGFEDKRWEGHRGVPEPVITWDNTPLNVRRVVVVIHGVDEEATDEDLRVQVEGALGVGVSPDNTPDLFSYEVVIEETLRSWFALVEDEFAKLSLGGPVNLEPEHVEPLWLQAWPAAEVVAEDETTVEHETARRVALAIALLAYGEGVLASLEPPRPSDTSELPLSPVEAEVAFGVVTGHAPRAADLAAVVTLGNTRGVLAEYVWDHWFGEPTDVTAEQILAEIDEAIAKIGNA